MSFPVKYFHSGMAGAPVLSGQAGTLISILKTCLINGFNTKTVNSLVVTSNVAVATISAGSHGFTVGSIIKVAGASPDGLNVEAKVTAVTNTTVTFATTGISDQTATGTITMFFAPLGGWSEVYAGTTNKLVLRSDDITGTRLYYQFDDTAANLVSFRGYESMSDAVTGVDPFPTFAQQSGTFGIPKSSTSDSTARNWWIIGDGKLFYMGIAYASPYPSAFMPFCIGEPISYKAGDAKCGICCGSTYLQSQVGENRNWYVARNMAQSGKSGKHTVWSAFSTFGTNANVVFPALADNGVHLGKVYFSDSDVITNGNYQLRGEMPGWYSPNEYRPGTHLEKVTQAGTEYIALSNSADGGGTPSNHYFSLSAWR